MDLLIALANLADKPVFDIPEKGKDYDNNIQEVGSGLEAFFKLLFIEEHKPESLVNAFGFQGSANHPPDLITSEPEIAFEIKKTKGLKSNLHLNSSYPEQFLTRSNPKITQACKESLTKEKVPLVYAIGTIANNSVTKLWLVDGAMYAANKDTYTTVSKSLSNAISSSGVCNLYETAEIANLREIDPLKITIMRVRGMWMIQHPSAVFRYLGDFTTTVTVLLSEVTYLLFSKDSRALIENCEKISLRSIKYKNPDNPSKLERGFVIEF